MFTYMYLWIYYIYYIYVMGTAALSPGMKTPLTWI
jgi:hypothetical protein